MKTLAAHGLAGGIVQDRMGGSFGAGFLSGSLYNAKKVSSRIGVFQRIVYCIAVSIITLCVIWRLNIGERRKGDWRVSDPLLPIIPALTNRGFTGHEHIDEMDLIHMNGRVYDPLCSVLVFCLICS
jgi:hypothetical protein